MEPAEFPRFQAVAEHGLLVEFGETIADAAHGEVLRLDAALARAPIPGFTEAVPAYASLFVGFDPMQTDHAEAEAALRALLAVAPAAAAAAAMHEIAVCYDAPFAPDLDAVARAVGLSREAVVAAHLAGDYRVYMVGFAPGYSYLGGVPAAIRLPRKPAAVRGVPAGSVIVAAAQCLVTTLAAPTGWWVIGRSPTRVFDPAADHPFLLAVGDRVRFRRVDAAAMGGAA